MHQTDADFDRSTPAPPIEDEDLALALPYAPPARRARLAALFALIHEIRRIPAAVSEPPLGEIRLQWWRDAADEVCAAGPVRAHPVPQALAATGGLSAGERSILEGLLDGRAQILYEPAFASVDALTAFVEAAEAPFADLLLGEVDASARTAAHEAAHAYALARYAPVIARPVADEAAGQAIAALERAAPVLAAAGPKALAPVIWTGLARGYARRIDGRPWPVIKRLSMFRAALTGRV
ncbi:MAG: squalene/phytoene synthase family protein [Parvularculaceae bacterium]|nr:squalene/phytoene synthase family protein [Parvularculaceae bacterium]